MVGFFPSEIVVFRVPDESCLDTTGERPPRGEDFGDEYDSIFRNWSPTPKFIMSRRDEKVRTSLSTWGRRKRLKLYFRIIPNFFQLFFALFPLKFTNFAVAYDEKYKHRNNPRKKLFGWSNSIRQSECVRVLA